MTSYETTLVKSYLRVSSTRSIEDVAYLFTSKHIYFTKVNSNHFIYFYESRTTKYLVWRLIGEKLFSEHKIAKTKIEQRSFERKYRIAKENFSE